MVYLQFFDVMNFELSEYREIIVAQNNTIHCIGEQIQEIFGIPIADQEIAKINSPTTFSKTDLVEQFTTWINVNEN